MPRSEQQLLLGEWACLGILAEAPAHGFAVASRLKPDGDIGRVWELSRALTYRSLSQLTAAGLVEEVGTERGIAGGTRTLLRPTAGGSDALQQWLVEPVPHLRDLRSELLLKLVLGERLHRDQSAMLRSQHRIVEVATERLGALAQHTPDDMIARWRWESAKAALAFLDHLTS
jgi:PadR family transcriptional regulator AphA